MNRWYRTIGIVAILLTLDGATPEKVRVLAGGTPVVRIDRGGAEGVPGPLTAAARDGRLKVAFSRESFFGHPKATDESGALERSRLVKELADAERLLAAARDRLANSEFVGKAPAAVVDGARAREAELSAQVDRLQDRLADLE